MRIKNIVVFMIAGLLLVGCSHAPLTVKPIAKTENPADLVGQLGADLELARKNQVPELAPNWFGKAQASFAKAKTALDRGEALSTLLENIATGRAELQQANKAADKAKYQLADLIESRAAAHKVGAQRFAKPLAKMDSEFLEITQALEQSDFKTVRNNREALNKRYRDLELRAITDAAVEDVRQMLANAKDQDMDEIAPKSYAMAQSKLSAAEAFIAKNRYDKENIQAHAAEARFYAQRLMQIARTGAKMKKMAPEEIVLWMENFLHQTNSQLHNADRRNLALDIQQEGIINAIVALQNGRQQALNQLKQRDGQIETLNQRVAELEGRTYKEKADKERLAAEKRFNELFNKVQGYFSSDEAEVYKKVNTLVIRLKAIRFPVGQAVIMPDNYALLKKVEMAIGTFGAPDVVIEGHTDSTGSQAKNQQLSQSRADSVKQYLVANYTLPASKYTAVGYGSSRPLASNQTAAGRAINRRIDMVIKPQMN